MNINSFTNNLAEKNGIWFSKTSQDISYPDEGNSLCYQLEDNSFWFRHRNSCIVSLVKRFSPNSVFFDIGGGNGFVAYGLQKIGVVSVLLEPGITGIENAKKKRAKQSYMLNSRECKL